MLLWLIIWVFGSLYQPLPTSGSSTWTHVLVCNLEVELSLKGRENVEVKRKITEREKVVH
jgi:hypothetical protein